MNGDKVNWQYTPRSEYSYTHHVAGIVRKIISKRVLIEVDAKVTIY